MALSKNLVEAQVEASKGNWAIRDAHKQFELYGKKAGIIGLGRIGRDTASLCTGIGMKVAGYDPFLTKEQIEGMGYEYYANYEDLLKDCDVISIHVPLTKETENMVSAKQLKEMKNTAIIINCSRGREALLRSAQHHRILHQRHQDSSGNRPRQPHEHHPPERILPHHRSHPR